MPEAALSCGRSGIVDKLSWDNIPQDATLQTYKMCKLNVIFELEHPRCLTTWCTVLLEKLIQDGA